MKKNEIKSLLRELAVSFQLLCWLIVVLCFFAGFFKAQGFALSLAFVFVAAILRTINDMNPNCKITE